MTKLRENKIIQGTIFVLLASSLGMFINKLDTLQFLLENGQVTVAKIDSTGLVEDIKTAKTLGVIIWSIAIGLYINYTYSLNHIKKKE